MHRSGVKLSGDIHPSLLANRCAFPSRSRTPERRRRAAGTRCRWRCRCSASGRRSAKGSSRLSASTAPCPGRSPRPELTATLAVANPSLRHIALASPTLARSRGSSLPAESSLRVVVGWRVGGERRGEGSMAQPAWPSPCAGDAAGLTPNSPTESKMS